MTTAVTVAPPPILQFLNNQGVPNVGGSLLTQVGGVNYPTYQDAAGTIPLPNPIPLNSRGEISNAAGTSCQLFLVSGQTYTATLFDANGNQLNQAISFDAVGDSSALVASLANSTVATEGPGQIGWGPTLTYPAGSLGEKVGESVSVLDYIPPSEHAAIRAYTSILDVSSYINAALAAYPVVTVPAGQYFGKFPLNMSARRVGLSGRRLIGDGADRVQFNWYTGNYPCVDATGQNIGELSGINFRSDNPSFTAGLTAADCGSIGLLMGRGNLTQQSNQFYQMDLRFNLTSDMTRNGGTGTVGIANNAAEHIIRDRIQIYANLPVCDHNGLQFTPTYSSNLPTLGVNYEQPYTGSSISNTIHENRNMQLIAWDSFRAMWLHQVGGSEWPNLYTSTRFLVTATPAYAETIYLEGSCTNVLVRCYQEVSGLFTGGVYRQDHAYITIDSGDYSGIDITIQRAALNQGFTLPSAAVSSIRLVNSPTVHDCRLNGNYLVGIYNSSGDNCGFAASPVLITGTPSLRNLELVTDQSGAAPRTGDIFSNFGQYCTNVNNRNWRSGFTRRSDGAANATAGNNFTPVAIGLTTAGVGTYTIQYGTFERVGGWCFFSLRMGWSAHTGTGGLAISGLPYTADPNAEQTISVSYDGLTVGAGKQMSATIPNSLSRILLNQCDPSGGALLGVQVDSAVTGLTLSGCFKVSA